MESGRPVWTDSATVFFASSPFGGGSGMEPRFPGDSTLTAPSTQHTSAPPPRSWSHAENAWNLCKVRNAAPSANAIGSTILRFRSVTKRGRCSSLCPKVSRLHSFTKLVQKRRRTRVPRSYLIGSHDESPHSRSEERADLLTRRPVGQAPPEPYAVTALSHFMPVHARAKSFQIRAGHRFQCLCFPHAVCTMRSC